MYPYIETLITHNAILIKMLQSSLLSPLDKAIKSALWTCLLIWHDRNWLCKRHKNALHFLLANSSEPSVEQVGLNEIHRIKLFKTACVKWKKEQLFNYVYNPVCLALVHTLATLESGINVPPWINIAPGTFVKNNKHSLLKKTYPTT